MTHARPLRIASALLFLGSLSAGCRHAQQSPGDPLDAPPSGERAAVVVASIDPAIPAAGPELRQARVELTRPGADPLAGLVAVALTGDPGAVEILVRGLGEAGSCGDAAAAAAFLPRQQAARPLWLALRLDCATAVAREAARALGLDALVEAARDDEELPDPPAGPSALPRAAAEDHPVAGAPEQCDNLARALRAFSPEPADDGTVSLPPELASLAEAPWALPAGEAELCAEPVLAAAARLRRGDQTVRLALDLALSASEDLPPHMVTFVGRYGLGAASPRLEDWIETADGALCAALVRAGRLEPAIPVLAEAPTDVPRCLYPAALALAGRQDAPGLEALAAIAATGTTPGCEAGAMAAALALARRDLAPPPRWATDPTVLGRALAETLALRRRDRDRPLVDQLRRLRAESQRLAPRRDPAPQDPTVRLLQRDLRAVLPMTTGPRTPALRLLLETGTR
jgi:hypothetical protein